MSSLSKLRPNMLLAGRYRILRLLGQGGMGRVYLAEDERLPGKQWAVKELEPNPAYQEAVANEVRFLAECSHPGLAAITDFIPPAQDGACYLIMEYIQGETLLEAFHRQQSFPWKSAVRIGIELCQVLAYLHEGRPRPIIHRDLKPSNVMLDESGRVKLIDFGTARHYNHSARADTMQLGTLGFAAPEQLMGRQTDARTDLYALGALLYYLLSGGCFWSKDGKSETGEIWQAVPGGLAGVIRRLLEEDSAQRFQSAAETAQALYALTGAPLQSASRLPDQLPGHPARQLIVVGGLMEGCGATFAAMALSRILKEHGTSHAVVELPGVRADLYHLLYGEKHAPKGYMYRTEAVMWGQGGRPDGSEKRWTDGPAEWVPLPPERELEGWTETETDKLLKLLEQPVLIFDIGCCWHLDSFKGLCREASLALLVCGPSPVHLSRKEASRTWMKLKRMQQEGTDVQVVANRSAEFRGREEWLEALPSQPLCYIPELPYAQVLSCLWRGELVADCPAFRPLLAAALQPAVAKIHSRLSAAPKKKTAWGRVRKALGL